jgi:hypothetical protein
MPETEIAGLASSAFAAHEKSMIIFCFFRSCCLLAWCSCPVDTSPCAEGLVLSDLIALSPHDTAGAEAGCLLPLGCILGQPEMRGLTVAAAWALTSGSGADQRLSQRIVGFGGGT